MARFDEPRPRKGWREATAPEIEAVAARAAGRVEAALAPPRAVAAGARKMAPVVVSEVRGAPGDGGQALARAMRRSLARIGIASAPAADEAALRVSGEVSIAGNESAPEGADVTIAWRVTRPDGAEVGTVTQSNRVPAEILEGRWGPLARTVAQAGAPGIAQLVRRVPAPEAPAAPRLAAEAPAKPGTAAGGGWRRTDRAGGRGRRADAGGPHRALADGPGGDPARRLRWRRRSRPRSRPNRRGGSPRSRSRSPFGNAVYRAVADCYSPRAVGGPRPGPAGLTQSHVPGNRHR